MDISWDRLVTGAIGSRCACRGLDVCKEWVGFVHPWDVFHSGRAINIGDSCCAVQPLAE